MDEQTGETEYPVVQQRELLPDSTTSDYFKNMKLFLIFLKENKI